MADVLLIYPQPEEIKQRRFGFSLNLLYLAAVLRQASHKITAYVDYSIEPFDADKLNRHLEKSQVVIIEFDAFPLKRTVNIRHGEEVVRYIKDKFPHKKIIVFGYDFVLFPRQQDRADFTLAAEPEKNILKAVDIVTGRVPEPAEFNPEPLGHLDELPFPDRGLLSPFAESGGSIDSEPHLAKSTLIETSRGCPARCVFCQRKGWQKHIRTHTPDYVVREFALLHQQQYKNIWIIDDNFTHNLERAKEILKALKAQKVTQSMKIALSSWAHIDEEFLKLAREACVSIISFGVESANESILNFYKKRIDLEKFRQLIAFADELGLYTVGNFILGAPMETDATITGTFHYILETPFDQVNIKILDYMVGSELYERLPPEKKGTNRHIFACKENDLNDFPLEVLRGKIDSFLEQFRKSRKNRLKEKMKQCGPPYFLL
ncbi:MAG: radical SAM protein [Candidatus Aminicenantes bacterium]|nr:radical SAM protein [Candidatus Aminicenantes bacterium]NIM79249.1 radical SAM protein [Candidatus Aminicenantes bacterium]NIN18535.1 radical SAM protein [Candidatus Aminicenantes bacterium]NIN42431.1 radical SAM protein [Candidatus Aminicenantes bacterium]NIN85190.1 radical SAM protein [Candidatus Aminicenantes bacterium]